MKKILNISSWVGTIVITLILWSFASKKEANQNYKNLIITVNHHGNNMFINQQDIKEYILGVDSFKNKPYNFFNISELEKKIDARSDVKSANVYRTINGYLHINVTPKVPIARVFNQNGTSFYVDKNGRPMSLSTKYTASVPVFSGNINIDFDKDYNFDVNDTDSLSQSDSLLISIYRLADFISNSPLWSAQIEQVFVNKDLTFSLIPRVGNHTIVFGKVENIKQKFERLKIFYNQGLSKVGWNKYQTINLSFKHQIVCTKY